MKPNVWNVKDILNIPMNSAGAKPINGGASSDYSSLPDSQFLFGSQAWPENSQSFSQEISGLSRGSQQVSQEVNETKVSSIYRSKPMLFVDCKVPNYTGGRALGILDRFEEEKRKAKETQVYIFISKKGRKNIMSEEVGGLMLWEHSMKNKHFMWITADLYSEILLGIRQLHESLENIQTTFLNCIDGSCDITRAAVAEGMDNFRKKIQDNFTTIKESIASQTEQLMSQMFREMKDNEAKTSLALKDLSSLVLSLQQDLESVKLERSKEQSLLKEILSLRGTIMTAYSPGAQLGHVQMIDNTVQTSPGLVSQFCVVSDEKHDYKGMKLYGESISYLEKRKGQSICPIEKPSPDKRSRKLSFRVIGTHPFQKQPHTEPVRSDPKNRKKSYCLHSNANSSPSPSTTSSVAALLQDAKSYMVGGHVHVKPVMSLNDITKSKSAKWIEVPREKKVLKSAQRCPTIRKKKRALILPQRRLTQGMTFDNMFEETQHYEYQENRVPQSVVSVCQKASKGVSGNHLPPQQPSTTRLMNMSVCGQQAAPLSLSQSSNSSQMIVEYQQAEWKTEQKANTIQRPQVRWQLFDFISDSD